jgi:hypothetical protein
LEHFAAVNMPWTLPVIESVVALADWLALTPNDVRVSTQLAMTYYYTNQTDRALRVVARQQVSLLHIRDGDAVTCELLDRCLAVSRYLLERAGAWLD